MRFERVRSVVTALTLAVVTVGVVALVGQPGAGPHSAPLDHDRRATLLLGTVDDALPVARPDDQRDSRGFGDRDVLAWSLPEQPHLWAVLESLTPAIDTRFESGIALAPRGPPPATASFVSP